jgi:hypothetical protein
MQHHPLGKASGKLHHSASNRVNKAIAGNARPAELKRQADMCSSTRAASRCTLHAASVLFRQLHTLYTAAQVSLGQSYATEGLHMAKSATALASELLEADPGGLEELHIHEFADDEEAHDDEAIDKLYEEFSSEFDHVVTSFLKKYGKPSRTGKEDDEAIPLNGVFQFAVWSIGDKQLFLAAAHEDRGVPILLMLGTADGDGA